MKVVVTGGRDFDDLVYVRELLSWVKEGSRDGRELMYGIRPSPLTHVIHGGAKGADTLAGVVDNELRLQEVVCTANWNFLKKGAGHVRNRWMLDLLNPETDLLLVCPGGVGTTNCWRQAIEQNIAVLRNYPLEEAR